MANENIQAEAVAEDIEKDQYLVFSIKGQEFAIRAMKVQEISAPISITKVPTAPPYIEGILNLRGQLATVFDFRRKFGFEEKARDEDTRIVIIEHAGFPIGMIVDSVEEVLKISDERVQPMPEAASTLVSKEYISGVGMLEKRLIIMLDVEKILSRTELREVEAARMSVRSENKESK
ncbi:MAG: chemotaxis protein CheW [Nitrospinae bacterium]|nr:chemotaxis protein CheW [Nitrospinota bacterium]